MAPQNFISAKWKSAHLNLLLQLEMPHEKPQCTIKLYGNGLFCNQQNSLKETVFQSFLCVPVVIYNSFKNEKLLALAVPHAM